MKYLFFQIVLLFCLTQTAQTENVSRFQVGNELYVLSQDGLSLREHPQSSSNRLIVLKYGAKVVVIKPVQNLPKAEIDNLQSQWVYVKYEEYSGYIFGGYLSRLPAPQGASILLYGKSIGAKTTYSTSGEGFGTTWQESTLILSEISIEEAFLFAKIFRQMPKDLSFPKPPFESNMIVNDPQQPDHPIDISLTAKTNQNGMIVEIEYYQLQKNFEKTFKIKRIESSSFEITLGNLASW